MPEGFMQQVIQFTSIVPAPAPAPPQGPSCYHPPPQGPLSYHLSPLQGPSCCIIPQQNIMSLSNVRNAWRSQIVPSLSE